MTSLRFIGLASVLVLGYGIAACGGDDEGTGGSGGSTSSSSGTGGSSSTSGTGGSSSTSGTGGSSSSTSGTGGGSPDCGALLVNSACGDDASVVRVLALLGGGMSPTNGDLYVQLSHASQDGASSPGGFHTDSWSNGVTLDPSTPVEHHIDMCTGSAMWSEENGQFNLWAYLDTDGNGSLGAGEPAGQMLVDLSCHDSGSQCQTLVLDCTNGTSCVADGVGQGCSCTTPACTSAFSICGC